MSWARDKIQVRANVKHGRAKVGYNQNEKQPKEYLKPVRSTCTT